MNIDDDLEPQVLIHKPETLQSMSIEELRAYIEELQGEIARVNEIIAAKERHRSGADAIFKV